MDFKAKSSQTDATVLNIVAKTSKHVKNSKTDAKI